MKYNAVQKLSKIAKSHLANVELEESTDDSFSHLIISKSGIDLTVGLIHKDGNKYAYDIQSTHLPRDIYIEDTEDMVSRDTEVIKNISEILNGSITFVKDPSLFNRNRGFITLEINGHLRKIYLKKNTLGFNEI